LSPLPHQRTSGWNARTLRPQRSRQAAGLGYASQPT
jgi:hypothetical protein